MCDLKLKLDGERVQIRPLRFSDEEDIFTNVRDKDVVKWTSNIPWPYPDDAAYKFIRKTHYEKRNRNGYTFGIVLKEINSIVGVASLFNINWDHSNAEIGFWIGKRYWNRGLMTEAVKLILRFGFHEIRLHRIYAGLFEKNIGSRRVLEKTGFKLEGVLKETRFKCNKWHNEFIYRILKSEYENQL